MIIVNALLLVLVSSPTTDAYSNFHQLSDQLDDQIEWIDEHGESLISKSKARKLLRNYAQGLDKNAFSVRHASNWKNDKCFRIIHLQTNKAGYRIFFQCSKKEGKNQLVTKVKITRI